MKYLKASLAIGGLILAGALMAQNAEAKTPNPFPPSVKVSAKSLALPVACADTFNATQTRVCHAGLSVPRSKGKKSRNIGTPQLNGVVFPPIVIPESILNPQPAPQKPFTPNYDLATAHCMVICT
jgi:hypothetical protein